MKKLIDCGKSPWPMLILLVMATVVAVLSSLDWSYSQYDPAPNAESTIEETPPPRSL